MCVTFWESIPVPSLITTRFLEAWSRSPQSSGFPLFKLYTCVCVGGGASLLSLLSSFSFPYRLPFIFPGPSSERERKMDSLWRVNKSASQLLVPITSVEPGLFTKVLSLEEDQNVHKKLGEPYEKCYSNQVLGMASDPLQNSKWFSSVTPGQPCISIARALVRN